MDSSSVLETAVSSAISTAGEVVTIPSAGIMFSAIALAIILVIIVGLVFWLMTKNSATAIEKLEARMEKMQETLQDMNAKLWPEPVLDNKIENAVLKAIRDHESTYHNQD